MAKNHRWFDESSFQPKSSQLGDVIIYIKNTKSSNILCIYHRDNKVYENLNIFH